jgi:hypothetical protein
MSGYVGFRHVRGPQGRSCRKGVPSVTIKMMNASVARSGAALPRVAGPCANLSSVGLQSILPQNSDPVAGTQVAFATPRRAVVMPQPHAVTAAWLPIDIRKQYANKTRVNVGGDGASGPHPEREPA